MLGNLVLFSWMVLLTAWTEVMSHPLPFLASFSLEQFDGCINTIE
jgi:hypothetical protein